MGKECLAIQAAQRLLDLCIEGCSLEAIQVAIKRSSDEIDLLVNIAVIEDLFNGGLISETYE